MKNILNVLFITMEYSAATFSGNGIYAQSQVFLNFNFQLKIKIRIYIGKIIVKIGA